MDKWPSLLIMVSILAVVLYSAPAGYAQMPGIPMVVSGQVTLNGNPAPDGYNITAWDNGAAVGSTLTSGGNYSITVCGQAGQTCNQGDTISFQLDQLTTSQTTSFNRGFPATVNLAFTGTPSQPAQQAATTTTQPSITEAVTITSSVTTPEYPSYLPVMIVALLMTLGIMFVVSKRNRRT